MRLVPFFLMVLFLSTPALAQDGKRGYPVNECNPEMVGDRLCKLGTAQQLWKISLSVGADGLTRMTKQWGGLCTDCHDSDMKEVHIVDGKRHMGNGGMFYSASCNHRTRNKGYKVYRYARRFKGKIYISEYIVLGDGRLVFASFVNGARMEGYDVANSSHTRKPDYVTLCRRYADEWSPQGR